ncbi:MAG: (Na+)-NQR maturation NqrM [Planctomycetes bacterium]|nr:(Na+)-NQR maturation NqrM [Planctomycetota bacterium]
MLPTILIATAAFLIVVTIMSVGVLFGRKPIQGSCGGLSALSKEVGQPLCEVCGGDPAKAPPGCAEFDPEELAAPPRSSTEHTGAR